MRYLLVLFIIMPIVEMWLLIVVGQQIGASLTIIMVLLTAVIGLHGLRRQGLSTLSRLQNKLSSHQLPAKEIIEGVILAVGGAFLLTPGFITDTIGFSCLLPITRSFWLMLLVTKLESRLSSLKHASFGHSSFGQNDSSYSADIIEGECSEDQEKVKK